MNHHSAKNQQSVTIDELRQEVRHIANDCGLHGEHAARIEHEAVDRYCRDHYDYEEACLFAEHLAAMESGIDPDGPVKMPAAMAAASVAAVAVAVASFAGLLP